ncbi:pseudouridine synthase [Diaphorobacter sp. HDW4B]|uniref:pseudouridine synthase n=1 Tax=Diaphorobacter sp. HDW4B TaxID=2714925 RepID=UPI00140DEE24|nr:pseudouridine synthase [Diaphorobacter sp. HDW4B]QIL69698.1 pseudouridine synthase [Diaphorobacter sp. HDW4B]
MNDSTEQSADEQNPAPTAAPEEKKPRRRRTTKVAADATEAAAAPTEAVSETAETAEPAEKPKRKRAPRKTKADAEVEASAEVPAEIQADPEPVAAVAEAVVEKAEPQPEAASPAVVAEVASAQAAEDQESQQAQPRDGERGERGNRNQRNNNDRGRQRNDNRGEGRNGDRRDGRRPQQVAGGADEGYKFADVISGQLDRDEEDEAVVPTKRVLPPQAETPKLHKVLAQVGLGSRLEMEQLILEGRISVNNEPAHIGQRVQFGDQIKINGKPIRYRIAPPPVRVLAYHKPVGEVVTHDDPQNRPTVFRKLPRLVQGKWQSVGRLDLNTEGLLLFTSSGDLANKLMHPRFGLEREYAVRVLGALSNDEKARLLEGVQLEDGVASFGSIEDGGGEGANQWYRVTISEGRNREVRRMMESVGHAVSRLIRIRYGAMMLPRGLKRGAWMELDERDIRALVAAAGAGEVLETRSGGNADSRGGAQGQGQGRGGNNNRRTGGLRSPLGNGGRGGNRQNQGGDGQRGGPRDQGGGYGGQGGGQGGYGGGQERSAGGGGGRNNQNNRGRGGNSGGGSSQPDPMKTSVGYIGSDSFSRQRQQQRNNGPRRRDR